MLAIWTFRELKKNSEKLSLKKNSNRPRRIAISLIAVYQGLFSPLWPPSCRFYPTCSTYAQDAIAKYGIMKGGVLAFIRIFKCHPFHPGGYDPLR